MIATMLQHSQLHRGIMLDWLRYCEERGEPFPTHEAIAAKFEYPSVEVARTLLADLADRGKISIDRAGTITIADQAEAPARHRTGAPKTVTRLRARPGEAEISEDEGAERMWRSSGAARCPR
jgi:hypothetical protein